MINRTIILVFSSKMKKIYANTFRFSKYIFTFVTKMKTNIQNSAYSWLWQGSVVVNNWM